MVWPVHEAVFRDLRKLAAWISTSPQRSSLHIERVVKRLGTVAIPLLGRELRSAAPERRGAARDVLEMIAMLDPVARARVTTELHAITSGVVADEAKVVALGLLSELGEQAHVRFADPRAIRTRSAVALAAHLETAADLAGAADLMVRQLAAGDIVQMLEVMADAAPGAAHRLATELGLRLDVAGDLRARIAQLMATIEPRLVPAAIPDAVPAVIPDAAPAGIPGAAPAGMPRPVAGIPGPQVELTRTAVLVDAAARLVVIASREIASEQRWRRFTVLIGASGRIEDCLHEDEAGPDDDAGSLISILCADGYRVVSRELDHAHEVVAAAARLTTESTRTLPSPYYLGRDLLDLGDAHLGARGHGNPTSAVLARAIELVAAGDHARALPLLERCDPDNPDAAAALAALLLGQHRPAAALAALDRALAAEPDWPLHHWNRAAALHQLGDARGCYHALRRFVATSAAPSGLLGDPAQPARVGAAERMLADLERTARLTGRSLGRRARPRATRKKRGSASS
jgi:tetratricopeptide (TPR) repeat protein